MLNLWPDSASQILREKWKTGLTSQQIADLICVSGYYTTRDRVKCRAKRMKLGPHPINAAKMVARSNKKAGSNLTVIERMELEQSDGVPFEDVAGRSDVCKMTKGKMFCGKPSKGSWCPECLPRVYSSNQAKVNYD